MGLTGSGLRPKIPKEAKVYDILSEYSHTVTEEKYRILDHDSRILCRESNRQLSEYKLEA
jgi:hypothetical protein